jgi:hypothetical protein
VVLAGILLARFCSPGVVVISRYLIVLRRESARDWVRSGREFLGLMVRAGAVVDKIGVVSAYSEGLVQVMGLFGDVSGAVVPGLIRKLFGETQVVVVVVNLNPRELLVVAREVTI